MLFGTEAMNITAWAVSGKMAKKIKLCTLSSDREAVFGWYKLG